MTPERLLLGLDFGLRLRVVSGPSAATRPRGPEVARLDARTRIAEALASRAVDATRLAAEAAQAASLQETTSRRFESHLRRIRTLGTKLVSRWLITGQEVTRDELDFISRIAQMAAEEGFSIGDMTRSYLIWRDANLRILDEEAERLGTPRDLRDEVREVIRSSSDRSIVRLARTFDSEGRRLREVLVSERTAFQHQALHDPLTGLPNRSLLQDRLAQAIRFAEREGGEAALLVVDLDGFKAVNDRYGHPRGDIVLQDVARRLPMKLRGTDTVSRLGGDEFAIVLPGVDRATATTSVAKIRRGLKAPVVFSGGSFIPTASIGVAVYPDDGTSADDLMRHADDAMYRNKRRHPLRAVAAR